MDYIIFDLELNTPFQVGSKNDVIKNKRCPNEIIEIGAIKINDNLKVVSEYQSFIRPTIYKRLSPTIRRKTKITYKDIFTGKRFNHVLKNFKKWIDSDNYILYSWGYSDYVDFQRNCKYHHLKTDWLENYNDLQKEFGFTYGKKQGEVVSLVNALNLLDIYYDDGFHRALVDARYTSQVFINMRST